MIQSKRREAFPKIARIVIFVKLFFILLKTLILHLFSGDQRFQRLVSNIEYTIFYFFLPAALPIFFLSKADYEGTKIRTYAKSISIAFWLAELIQFVLFFGITFPLYLHSIDFSFLKLLFGLLTAEVFSFFLFVAISSGGFLIMKKTSLAEDK